MVLVTLISMHGLALMALSSPALETLVANPGHLLVAVLSAKLL
jgi:hypothetical protein